MIFRMTSDGKLWRFSSSVSCEELSTSMDFESAVASDIGERANVDVLEGVNEQD